MGLEVRMRLSAKKLKAMEHMFRTLGSLGIMNKYLILGELRDVGEETYYTVVIRIIEQKKIYRIEVEDE